MICPKCRSRAIGRIGQNQYYCWDCNIEFTLARDGFRVYRLEPDGTTILDSPSGKDVSPCAGVVETGAGEVMPADARVSPAGSDSPA